MFHGATISRLELAELRRIKHIVRMGRGQHLQKDRIVLDEGSLPTSPDHLHIDCSASALSNLEIVPVFAGDLITPQTVRSYQPVFSAAFIAHIEAACDSEEEKNRLCGVVPLPNHDTDWIRMMVALMMNQHRWSQNPDIRQWLHDNRLDGFSKMVRAVAEDESEIGDGDLSTAPPTGRNCRPPTTAIAVCWPSPATTAQWTTSACCYGHCTSPLSVCGTCFATMTGTAPGRSSSSAPPENQHRAGLRPGQRRSRTADKTAAFMLDTALKSRAWLKLRKVDGLQGLAAVYPDVCGGRIAADEGLIVEL